MQDLGVADIEKNLSSQEMELVKYHRNSIATGKVGRDQQGRPVTVYSMTIQVPDGPNKGKFVTVPGFVGGQIVEDEEALWQAWGPEINKGKWPVYDDPTVAGKRAQYLHGIMDIEGDGRQSPHLKLYGGTP